MATHTIEALESLLESLGVQTPIPFHTGSAVLNRPLDITRAYLANTLQDLVPDYAVNAYSAIQAAASVDVGDLVIITPRLDRTCDAEDLAEELFMQFPEVPLLVPPVPEGVQLRLFLDEKTLPKWLIPYILERGASYGTSTTSSNTGVVPTERKHVVIEFSSPNIESDLNGKHMRSTLLGAQLSNLYKASGWNVTQINYLGDWGKAIALLGAGFEKHGSQEALKSNPLSYLHDVYQRTHQDFLPEQQKSRHARDEYGDDAARKVESEGLYAERNAFFKRMEEADPVAIEFAENFRNFSIEHYKELYARLGVSFDEYSGESQMTSIEDTAEIMQMLEEKGLIEESGGALTIDLRKHGSKHGTAIIRDRDGSGTYLLRDLVATVKRHKQYNFDKMVYVVAADSNKIHFSKLFKILELMGFKEIADKLQHVSFSENTHIAKVEEHEPALSEFFELSEAAIRKSIDTDCEESAPIKTLPSTQLCNAALFAQVAAARNSASMIIDAAKLSSLDSGSGLDLLQWYHRLRCFDEPAVHVANLEIASSGPVSKEDGSNKKGDKDRKAAATRMDEARSTLLRLLARYPEILDAALHTSDPAVVMTYLTSITSYLKVCLPHQSGLLVDNANHNELFQAVEIVMRNALELLGVLSKSVNRDSGVYY